MDQAMAEKKAKWIKTAKIIYWVLTIFAVVFCMMTGGVFHLMHAPQAVEGIMALGYPEYLLTITGTAKLLGGLAILQGRFYTLKDWGYCGYTINLIGASASHYLHGDPANAVATPLIILAILMVSYRQWKTGWM